MCQIKSIGQAKKVYTSRTRSRIFPVAASDGSTSMAFRLEDFVLLSSSACLCLEVPRRAEGYFVLHIWINPRRDFDNSGVLPEKEGGCFGYRL